MTQTNRKPVDRLAYLRESIRRLETEEEQLRSEFIAGEHDPIGDEYQVVIVKSEASRVEVKALRSTMTPEEVQPYLRKVPVVTVRTELRDDDAA